MINFRYHVVSLAAVFLALAIGLVVGTAAANGPVTENLNDQVNKITGEKQQLRDDLEQARGELSRNEAFATEVAPMLLAGKLAGRNTLVVDFESDDDDVADATKGIIEMLRTAGATVTGRVTVRDKFLAESNQEELLHLTDSAAPPSISGALPNQAKGPDTSAALLAAVLTGKAGAPQVEDTRAVLSAYQNAGYITVDGDFKAPAEAVVIVTGGAPTGKDAKYRAAAALAVTTRFEMPGARVVVAGLSATGLVQAVRSDAPLSKTVSTIDNVVTAQGQVAAVLTLVERLGGKTGHYGVGDGATAVVPKSASVRDGS